MIVDVAIELKLAFPPPSPGGSYQGATIVATGAGDWEQRNDSHVAGQEGNLTHPSVNGTWLPPSEDFDPLGGHTVLQVNICPTASPFSRGRCRIVKS